jgi:hypothetical protein
LFDDFISAANIPFRRKLKKMQAIADDQRGDARVREVAKPWPPSISGSSSNQNEKSEARTGTTMSVPVFLSARHPLQIIFATAAKKDVENTAEKK